MTVPSDSMGLQADEHGPDTRVVTVVGEIDTLTAPEVANFLTAQLDAAQLVVVDLDGVQFIGSAGLSVLVEANELASQQDRDLQLVCHSRVVTRALEVTGLGELFAVANSVPDALNDSL